MKFFNNAYLKNNIVVSIDDGKNGYSTPSIENRLQPQNISRSIKFLYYGTVTLGYASLIAQLISAKFVFANCSTAFSSIAKHILHKDISPEKFDSLSFVLTFLDSTKDLSSISPEKDARKLFGIELKEGHLIVKPDLEMIANSPSKVSYWYYLKEFSLSSIPILAMTINFTNTAMPSWISMSGWIHDYPQFDIPVGITLLICHTSYFFLLSARDVMIGFGEMRNINKSPFGILFKLSKFIFTAPLIKIIITAAYRSAKSAFTLDEFATKVLDVKNNKLRDYLKIIAASSSCLVLIFSRSLASFRVYLQPVQTGEDQYNLDLISQEKKVESYATFKSHQKLQQIPVGLIRGFCTAFIIYGFTNDSFEAHNFTDFYYKVISLSLSMLTGALTFTHSYSTELDHEKNIHARKFIESTQEEKKTEIIYNGVENYKIFCLSRVISLGCNFGNQATESLLTVVAMISLIGPYIGNQYAATLGLMVGLESGWVNFHYFKDKIFSRVHQIINDGVRMTSKYVHGMASFFWRPTGYQKLEDIKLVSTSDSFIDSPITNKIST